MYVGALSGSDPEDEAEIKLCIFAQLFLKIIFLWQKDYKRYQHQCSL